MLFRHLRKGKRMFALLAGLVFSGGAGTALAAKNNPYPTEVIADYVFACMGSNGQTREALQKCSCSIDVIASIIDHDAYTRAETVLRLRRLSGEKSAIFKTSARWKESVGVLRRAQAEAEVRCF